MSAKAHPFDVARCLECGGALLLDPTLGAWACCREVKGELRGCGRRGELRADGVRVVLGGGR